MTTKPESRLQRKIRKALEQEVGGWWVKIHGGPYQEAGIPDLIGCVEGLFFGLEVKCPGAKGATPLQVEVMEDIRDEGGGAVHVVTSTEEAVEFVRTTLS